MSKLIFNGNNSRSYITLTEMINAPANGNPNIQIGNLANVTFTLSLGAQDDPMPISAVNATLEVANNAYLNLINSAHLSEINVNSNATVDLNNNTGNYDQQTNLSVTAGTLSITGIDLNLGSVVIGPNSLINFSHNNHDYSLKSPDDLQGLDLITIDNMETVLSTCEALNNKFSNGTSIITSDDIHHFAIYGKLDQEVKSLMEQNNMINSSKIDSFIEQSFFWLTGIAKDPNFPGSILEGAGNYNIVEHITSYLNFNDINSYPADNQDDEPVNIIGDENIESI
jgi:hypothetical protein